MKKIMALVALFTILFAFCSFGAKIDGEEIKSTLLNGTTMVPLEDLAKLLDLDFMPSGEAYVVSENNDTPRMLNFRHDAPDKVCAQLYSRTSNGSLKLADEQEMDLPEAAVRIDGKLYVPYRFVLEYFNANVYWSEKDGAYAYRTHYYEPTLIRTDGTVRERVKLSGSYENAIITGKYLVLIRGGDLLRVDLTDGSEKVIGKSGRLHVEGNKLFVMESGKLTMIDVESCESKTIDENVRMIGYLTGGGAWCDKGETASVYDAFGNHLADVTGSFVNPWEYQDGYVYYINQDMSMRRAKPDGTQDEFLIKIALYPEWVDGYIYYTDSSMNYRRFDVKTGEDIMVYGLNLEFVRSYKGKHIFNFYSEKLQRLFISNPDGTEFKPFGDKNIVVSGTPAIYKDGLVAREIDSDLLYYITEDSVTKLTDDMITELCGVYDGFVYYTVE